MRQFRVIEDPLNDNHTRELIGQIVTEVSQVDDDMITCVDSNGIENDFAFEELIEIKTI